MATTTTTPITTTPTTETPVNFTSHAIAKVKEIMAQQNPVPAGLRVGVVRNGKAELVPITIGRDYGDRVEVLSGLQPHDQIILNPSDSLVSGQAVRLAGGKPDGAA